MEHLANLFVALIELAEAELESAKRGVLRFGLSVVFLVIAGIAGAIGLILMLAAAFVVLQMLLNTAAALAISGAAFVAVAAGLVVLAMRRTSKSKNAATPSSVSTVAADQTHEQISSIRIAS